MLVLEKEKLPLIFSINQKFETLFTQIAEEIKTLMQSHEDSRTQSAEENRIMDTLNEDYDGCI